MLATNCVNHISTRSKTLEQNIKIGMIYTDIFNSCEKIGDHIINITEAIIEEKSIVLT